MKHCIDCKHFVPAVGSEPTKFARCSKARRPEATDLDYADFLVGGGAVPDPQLAYCRVERASMVTGDCGKDGLHFEPKEQAVAA